MKKKPKISYDKESEVLSLEISKSKSVDSDIQGNVVIDYGKKGEVVRINLYSFSFDDFKNGHRALKDFARDSKIPVSVG